MVHSQKKKKNSMMNRTWDLGFNSLICVVDIDTKTQFYDHLPIIARKPYNHTPNDGMYYVMHLRQYV